MSVQNSDLLIVGGAFALSTPADAADAEGYAIALSRPADPSDAEGYAIALSTRREPTAAATSGTNSSLAK